MAAKSVVFIEPAGSEANVFEHYMNLPLMGTLYMGTILHNAGYEVRILNENILHRQIDLFSLKADVFCISALTVSTNRAKVLAHNIQRMYPESKLIIGGIHASLCAETFDGLADHIVSGEGETVILDIVEGRCPDRIVHAPPVEDLDTLPPVQYSLLEGHDRMDVIPIMTSRGCPFDCNFCTVTKIFGRRFRMQSPQRVLQEVRHSLQFFRTNTIFFYDDNFTADRKRVHALCSAIQQQELDIEWVTQVRSDIAADVALLRHMERAGCRYFFIGFESISDETLKAMHKSQSRKDIEHAIQTIRETGIHIHGMFIFGEDHDTPQTLQATVDFAVQHHIDTVQFMILTPFPGTQCFDELAAQDRIIHRQWDYYNGMYAVFQPANMSATQLQQHTLAAYERFYSLRRHSLNTLRLLVDIVIDALTLNFHKAFSYSFDTVFLRAGARFLVGRYAATYDSYLSYLQRLERQKALQPQDVQ
jgi:radical SAM superfamily enzyme YgiQ (UPF0313 family)